MSQLEIVERTSPRNDSDPTDTASEIEETRSDSYRRTLYEGLRQRDAWLRKAWGHTSPIVVEFQ
jgi:hypothetical protein